LALNFSSVKRRIFDDLIVYDGSAFKAYTVRHFTVLSNWRHPEVTEGLRLGSLSS
jgi:hypothetical protein